jgi:UDP-N-acetylmuramoyl-tripeptide--D-alanyl-D-alanine ligase
VIALTLAEVAEVTGGRVVDAPDPAAAVTGPVVVDSRLITPGGLFVAIRGDRVDGHDFAGAAVAAGAVAVLAARPVGVPAVVVQDVVAALGLLARAVLSRATGVRVVGITGSSGKTSTKDLLAQVLERHGSTVAPPGSYNNEIGLPLTVLRVEADTRHLVVELGARGLGHIAALCAVAPPTVGVVLNVGSAHLGEFGSREAVAAAKGELVEALGAEGVAVLNGDDPLVRAMAARTAARVVTTGWDPAADVRAADLTFTATGYPRFRLSVDRPGEAVGGAGSEDVTLRLLGEHQVPNALAATAAALAMGMTLPDVAAALREAGPRSPWRMEVTERADGVTIINDAYNANPESVRAALKALVTMAGGRRTWAVLGEMRELGAGATREHDAIGRLAVRLDISRLVAVGPATRPLHLGAVMEGSWGEESVHVPDLDTAVALLGEALRPGDVVLVKASRAGGLERLAQALVDQPLPEWVDRR